MWAWTLVLMLIDVGSDAGVYGDVDDRGGDDVDVCVNCTCMPTVMFMVI